MVNMNLCVYRRTWFEFARGLRVLIKKGLMVRAVVVCWWMYEGSVVVARLKQRLREISVFVCVVNFVLGSWCGQY